MDAKLSSRGQSEHGHDLGNDFGYSSRLGLSGAFLVLQNKDQEQETGIHVGGV